MNGTRTPPPRAGPEGMLPAPGTVPTPGRFYAVQAGRGGLLATAGRAYGLPAGAARLARAREINDHPRNRKLRRAPRNGFERAHFREGVIDFTPAFTCGAEQRRAEAGERRCYARVWIPPLAPEPPRRVPGGPVAPRGPATPGFRDVPRLRPRLLPAPREGASCGSEAVKVEAQRHWSRAATRLDRAIARVRGLAALPLAERRRGWSAGAEREWFGAFSQRSLAVVLRRLEGARRVLRDPALAIACAPGRRSFAYSSRALAPKRITLAAYWLRRPPVLPRDRWLDERTQTFVHEAAHLAGVRRKLFGEVYSPESARRLARRNPAGALNNADNYGYYAMGFR